MLALMLLGVTSSAAQQQSTPAHAWTIPGDDGRSGAPDDRPLDGETMFQIGSVTKVFTGLLLADMVQRGEVDVEDPASK